MVEEASRNLRIMVRPGRPDEGERLKELAIAAKCHWGYERDRVRAWADQGDFSPQRLAQLTVFVAEANGRAVGWSSLIPRGDVGWLEDLWVEPAWMGRGVGARLFRATAAEARSVGATVLEWEAEPNAIGFYEKMGGTYRRDSKPTEWGRTVSVMGIDLDD